MKSEKADHKFNNDLNVIAQDDEVRRALYKLKSEYKFMAEDIIWLLLSCFRVGYLIGVIEDLRPETSEVELDDDVCGQLGIKMAIMEVIKLKTTKAGYSRKGK